MTTTVTPKFAGSMASAMAADTKDPFGAFSAKSGLPEHLSLEGLVSWLSAKMGDTDAEIKKHMSEINGQKDAEAKLHDLIAQLQGCIKKDAKDGCVDVPTDLTDATKVRDSALYKSMGPEGKKVIDDMLAKVRDPEFTVTDDIKNSMGVVVYPKGAVIWGGDVTLAKGYDASKVVPHAARMSNDDLETSIKSLTETASAIGSNDEVNMIGLQTQISARAQLVQLVSNMISSVTDTNRSIIQNCKV